MFTPRFMLMARLRGKAQTRNFMRNDRYRAYVKESCR